MNRTLVSREIIRRGHEIRDVNARSLFWFAVIFLATAILIHVAVALLFKVLVQRRPATFAAEKPTVRPHGDWPEPAQQIFPAEDLKEFRAREQNLLHSYGWANREQGVVRIPIERAMELLLREQTNQQPETTGARHD